jgi:hypothetical protein
MQLRYVFGLFCFGDVMSLSNREMVGLFGITHRTWIIPGAMRIPSGCHVLIVSASEVGQRPVAADGTVVIEYHVPRESRGSRIRIERRRHLISPRVSVDAVLKRDGVNATCGNTK